MRHSFLRLLVFFLASLPVFADSTPHWFELKTEHFTIITDSSERDARRVAVQFERMRTVFHVIMPQARDDAAAPIIVVACRDKKSFRTLEPEAYLGKNQLDLAGYFLRAQDRNYVLVRLDAEGDHPFATVYHEYTHYMLRKSDDWIPLWLNEGLAEFYQNTTLKEKDTVVGQPSDYDILYLRQNRLLPLPILIKVDHNSPYYHEDQKGSAFYAESWALTHYLETSDAQHNTHRLQEYSRLLIQHQDPVTAAQTAFGDLGALQKALDSYIQQSAFVAFRLTVPTPFSESSFNVQPLPTPQADAIRADVLLDVQRTKDSQTLLESVLQTDPRNALAHEVMGSIKFHEKDLPAARKWYGEAVGLDSQSYLAHYYFALMSLSANDRDHDDAIEQSLRDAIKLNPRFAPAFDALAEFYSSRHEKLDEAHVLGVTAVSLEPESLAYRLNVAQVLAENKQYDNSIRVLKAARPLAKSLDETGSVDRRIADLEQYQAAVAQGEAQRTSSPTGEITATALQADGTRIETSQPSPVKEPDYPAGAPTGPHHTVTGLIHDVKCVYPTILTMTLSTSTKPIPLYTNNYFKVAFSTANYTQTGDLTPCTAIKGMKARVEFGEVKDPRVAGQVLSVELSR